MRLFIAHHGQTPYTLEKRFLGHTDDPLTPLGLLQAQALAERLAGERITAVVASDLRRAVDTAAAIASLHSMTVQIDSNLRAVNMGAWEGRVHADVRREEPDLFRRWQDDPTQHFPSGGESLVAVQNRAVQALESWQTQYPTQEGEEEPVIVWVTHTTFMGVLLCHLLGLPLVQRRNFHTDSVCLSEIHLLGDRGFVIRSLNDTSHLRNRPELRGSTHGAYLYIR